MAGRKTLSQLYFAPWKWSWGRWIVTCGCGLLYIGGLLRNCFGMLYLISGPQQLRKLGFILEQESEMVAVGKVVLEKELARLM
jgi:hypothetical protein